MAKSLPILCLVLFFLAFNSGGLLKLAEGQGKTWCVAKPSTKDIELMNNIKYVCDLIKEACGPIQPGGDCYNPNTPINHASVVMNYYYQQNDRQTWDCHFGGSGLIAITDPSYGSCQYA